VPVWTIVSFLLACMNVWLVNLDGERRLEYNIGRRIAEMGVGWRLNLHVWRSEIWLELGKQLTPQSQRFDHNIRSLHLQCPRSHLQCTGYCVIRKRCININRTRLERDATMYLPGSQDLVPPHARILRPPAETHSIFGLSSLYHGQKGSFPFAVNELPLQKSTLFIL
jgi:hypothetical protein